MRTRHKVHGSPVQGGVTHQGHAYAFRLLQGQVSNIAGHAVLHEQQSTVIKANSAVMDGVDGAGLTSSVCQDCESWDPGGVGGFLVVRGCHTAQTGDLVGTADVCSRDIPHQDASVIVWHVLPLVTLIVGFTSCTRCLRLTAGTRSSCELEASGFSLELAWDVF